MNRYLYASGQKNWRFHLGDSLAPTVIVHSKRMRRNRFHEVPKMVSLHHYLAVIIPANGNSLNKSYFAITKHSTITISCRIGVFLILSVSGGD